MSSLDRRESVECFENRGGVLSPNVIITVRIANHMQDRSAPAVLSSGILTGGNSPGRLLPGFANMSFSPKRGGNN